MYLHWTGHRNIEQTEYLPLNSITILHSNFGHHIAHDDNNICIHLITTSTIVTVHNILLYIE